MIVKMKGKRYRLFVPLWAKWLIGYVTGIALVYIFFGIYADEVGHPIW